MAKTLGFSQGRQKSQKVGKNRRKSVQYKPSDRDRVLAIDSLAASETANATSLAACRGWKSWGSRCE